MAKVTIEWNDVSEKNAEKVANILQRMLFDAGDSGDIMYECNERDVDDFNFIDFNITVTKDNDT